MSKDIETNPTKNERIFRNILDSIDEGILVIDNKGGVIHYNELFKHIWELNEVLLNVNSIVESIMGKVKCKNNFKKKIEQVIGKYEEDLNVIFMNNGKVIEIYSKPLLDNNEKIGVVFTFKDIEKREKYYDALQENKERYKKLINFFPEAVAILVDHKIKFINTAFMNLVGCNRYLKIIGMDIREFVHRDNIEDTSKYIYDSRVNNKISKQIEIKLERWDKTIIDVEITSAYIPWKEENEFAIILRDITYKKGTEKALKKSEEQYRKLIEFLPAGIFIHSKGKVLFANSHFARLVGIVDAKELIGKDVMSLIHPKYRSIVKERTDKIEINNKSVPLLEEAVLSSDGQGVSVEVTGTPYIYQGKIACLVVVQDIAEKKKAEENRKLLNEALAYEKLRTEFFANLSHELRTPLNVIFGALQVIDMHMKGHIETEGSNKFKKYIKIMKQNSYRLMRLVNNIIDVTKLDAEYLEANLKNYNIIEIVENITQSVVEYALNKNIKIIFDTDIEEKIIACDPDKIERIMLNILSNALKFTDGGGKIFVNIYDKDNQIEISIKDTGIGIPEDKINTIFKRFVQVDKSLTRNHEGSGIGLSLVKSFVELHGGNIEVKSKLDVGSEFIIKLPVKVTEYDGEEDEDDSTIQNIIERINIEFSDIYS